MRLTIRVDGEVYAAAKEEAAARGVSIGQAINEFARVGLKHTPAVEPFVQKTYPMGMKLDCTNIAEVLDLLDNEEPYGDH
ncbi:hypothetical protein M5J20_10245 [Corynebacterium sp. TA-R-1]|uniref:CopG family transcriptional regulator n=1 Tax=Corynebacterium stercoris TaxID=2943490 RepID=A0ABT1G3E9_9CORY|nr:hypothetical protein [Corynebacterium stercoris]MCP1388553.1 hypothetical protein [Corynebacterium stercoris]